jgi:hypothetical protein
MISPVKVKVKFRSNCLSNSQRPSRTPAPTPIKLGHRPRQPSFSLGLFSSLGLLWNALVHDLGLGEPMLLRGQKPLLLINVGKQFVEIWLGLWGCWPMASPAPAHEGQALTPPAKHPFRWSVTTFGRRRRLRLPKVPVFAII